MATTTSGHGLNITASGASKHGMLITGGTSGTSDGIKAVAGSGGSDIRGNITGDLLGTVSTLTTYTGNTPQSGDAYARLGAPAGASVSADIFSLTSILGTPSVTISADIGTLQTTVDNLNNFDPNSDYVLADIQRIAGDSRDLL